MIEVLHERDPDGGCSLTVYLDGERVDVDVLADVDPGRGHEADEWDARTLEYARDDDCSPAFAHAVIAARTAARDSRYINRVEGGLNRVEADLIARKLAGSRSIGRCLIRSWPSSMRNAAVSEARATTARQGATGR